MLNRLPSLKTAPAIAPNEPLTQISPSNLRDCYGLTDEDFQLIHAMGADAEKRMPYYLERFYAWVELRPEFRTFFTDDERLRRAQSQQSSYWKQFFHARLDLAYLDRLKILGSVHAQIGLPVEAYLASVHLFLELFIADINSGEMNAVKHSKEKAIIAVTRLIHVETAVVISTFNAHTQEIIAEQSSALMELSTPVSILWDGILMLPIVGVVDSKRSQDIMNAMLRKIASANGRVMILDISGVNIVDTAVANYFIKMTKATMLMGCHCVLSGISPAIAQTIVALSIDLGEVTTRGNLKDAVAFAFEKVGFAVTTAKSRA